MYSISRTLAALACLAAIAPLAHAQSSYPDRPITLIVPFSAGGDADVAARNLSVVVQRTMNQSLIAVNRAGAGGAIGSMAVRTAKPDGYTLLMARVGSQVVLPALQKGLEYMWNSFTFLGLLELGVGVDLSTAISFGVGLSVRLLAIWRSWRLPIFSFQERWE